MGGGGVKLHVHLNIGGPYPPGKYSEVSRYHSIAPYHTPSAALAWYHPVPAASYIHYRLDGGYRLTRLAFANRGFFNR